MADQTSPLVAGGHLRQPLSAPEIYISHTVPEIYKDTIIVAATHPTVANSHARHQDGWFLSDFYAFNYLFKNAGFQGKTTIKVDGKNVEVQGQTWLTAADPKKIIDISEKKVKRPFLNMGNKPKTRKSQDSEEEDDEDDDGEEEAVLEYTYETYEAQTELLHGNPYRERRVVLNKELLDAGEYTPVTRVKSGDMIETFVTKVKHASQLAKQKDLPLLLFIFCHGLPNHHFLLNNGDKTKGLSATYLKGAIEPGCRVTLVTTACYSGGWVINPDFNHTTLAAARPKTTSNAWLPSASMGRSCGSIFAGSLIGTLTGISSPLLSEPAQSATEQDSIQPAHPSDVQTKTYNEFCRSILETCRTQHRLWDKQYFTFSAQDDRWDDSWTARTGIPLRHFEQRWNCLPIRRFKPEQGKPWPMLGPDPQNTAFDYDTPVPSLTGGIAQQRTLRASNMARLLLQTCPGDWTGGQEVGLRGRLELASQGIELDDFTTEHVMSLVEFRMSLAHLADTLVVALGLPKPGNEDCLMWNRIKWEIKMDKVMPDYDSRWTPLWYLFRDECICMQPPASEQGPPFYRFCNYLIAAIVTADKSSSESMEIARHMLFSINHMKRDAESRVLTAPRVRTLGKTWLKSIGRRFRGKSPARKRGNSDQKAPSSGPSDFRRRANTATGRKSISDLFQDLQLPSSSADGSLQ